MTIKNADVPAMPEGWRLVRDANKILKALTYELPRTVGAPNLYLVDKDVRKASSLLDSVLSAAPKLVVSDGCDAGYRKAKP